MRVMEVIVVGGFIILFLMAVYSVYCSLMSSRDRVVRKGEVESDLSQVLIDILRIARTAHSCVKVMNPGPTLICRDSSLLPHITLGDSVRFTKIRERFVYQRETKKGDWQTLMSYPAIQEFEVCDYNDMQENRCLFAPTKMSEKGVSSQFFRFRVTGRNDFQRGESLYVQSAFTLRQSSPFTGVGYLLGEGT